MLVELCHYTPRLLRDNIGDCFDFHLPTYYPLRLPAVYR